MSKFIIFDPEVCTRTDLRNKNVPDKNMTSLTRLINPPKDEENPITITPGNDYLLIGESCYKYINSHYHLGLRKTTYFQACEIPKITTSDGINFTFVRKVMGTTKFDPRLQFFLSKEFNRKLRPLPEDAKIITKDLEVGIEWMENWMSGKFSEPNFFGFGLDYETAQVDDGHKEICGVGIASLTKGIFIDFRFPKDKDQWNRFKSTYIKFCKFYKDCIWAYNAKFEFDRTNETFGEYVDFCDAGAMNIVDGRQKVYYSLKYTAQYYLGVGSWDDEFDEFASYIHKEIFKKYKNLEELLADKDRLTRFKKHFIDEDDFNEWVEIARLIPEYWGDRFWNQTSRNLGKYCILDSYHTLMIAAVRWRAYPDLANRLTVDNLRLGSQLMATGCFLDDETRSRLRRINWKFQCFALFKMSSAMYALKIEKVDDEFLSKLTDRCRTLIVNGYNPAKGEDFWKDISGRILDDQSESFLNEYETIRLLGSEVTEKLIGLHRRNKKSFINFTRSKKMKEDLARYRKMLFTDEDKQILKDYSSELSKISRNRVYEKRLKILMDSELWSMQFEDVDWNKSYMFGGKLRSLEDICHILNNSKGYSNGWYKWASPTPQKEAKAFFMNIMDGYPTAFTLNMYQKSGSMRRTFPDTVKDPKLCYAEWVKWYKSQEDNLEHKYKNRLPITQEDYDPEYLKMVHVSNYRKITRHFDEYNSGEWEFEPRRYSKFGDSEYDNLKDAAHSGWGRWSKVDSYLPIRTRTNTFGFEYDPETPYEIVTTCIKCMYMFSAYNKEMQYIDGVFSSGRKRVRIIDKDLRVKKDEDGDYTHINTKFNMCRLKTKRNSSGFHTIPHGTSVKGIIKAPKGYGMSYFDVSQAEPRLAAYLIDKDKMRDCYEKGMDLYYLTAASMHNQTYEEFRARPDAKNYRTQFKTVLLGLLYGMGPDTLGGRIGTDTDTAKLYIKALFDMFPKLKAGIARIQQYPLDNDRQCITFWGDKLLSEPCDDGALKRHGINYPVQGNTSLALTAGFFNVIQQCTDNNLNIRPVLAIHDALVNYFPIDQLWDLNAFYRHNFTDYLYEKCGVKFEFSVNYGTDYFNMSEITNLDEDTIKIDGSNQSIIQLLNELDSVGFKYEIIEKKSDIVPVNDVTMRKYNNLYGESAAYDEDSSFNSVIVKRLSRSSYNVPKY